jgi:hypothetical protein
MNTAPMSQRDDDYGTSVQTVRSDLPFAPAQSAR